MTEKKYLIGNWKMHGGHVFAHDLLTALASADLAHLEAAVLVPFPYLSLAEQLLQGSFVAWGAQNLHDQVQGAYTGEVSASMLCDFACRYVLVGHSERRHLFAENNACVAAKYQAAQASGIVPILCVGETLAQRERGDAELVVFDQLAAVFDAHPKWAATALVAYEPVWAIGTGHSATVDQVKSMHQNIEKSLSKWAESLAFEAKILYGGSVKPSNAAELFALPNVHGALVGGASLKATSFLEIASLCTPSFY